jgi:hypothetical protein
MAMETDELCQRIARLLEDCENAAPMRRQKRQKALDYFRGEMSAHVPSDEGRSKITSRDVRAVIKKVVPALKRTIMGSDQVVEYKPIGEGDEANAKAATQYVNKHVVRAAKIEDAISDAITSSLLLDEGVLTWWHEDKKRIAVTYHSGLSEAEIAALQADPDAELLMQEPYEVDINGMPETMYRVRVKRTITESLICTKAVPLEDMLIHPQSTSEDDAPLIGHIMRVSRSDLVAMGYDRELVDDLPTRQFDMSHDIERESRNPEDFDGLFMGNGMDGAVEEIEIHRLFVRVDTDDDGIAELREVHFIANASESGGNRILFDDYADEVNYAILVAERVMHSWQGVSLYDDVGELQTLKTVLTRQLLDNLYASNNPQPSYQSGTVLNPEAITSPEFGAPIVTKSGVSPGDAVLWRNVPFFAEKTLPMLAKIDADIVDRTGITSAAGGLDPNAMQNVREQGINMISDAAAAQAWCMVREMTRGGLNRFFRGVLKLVIQHQDKPKALQISGDWVQFDPRSWNADMDCEVNVGLGTGTRERDMQALMVVSGLQEKVIQAFGPENPFVGATELHNTMIRIAETAGLSTPSMFFREPQEGEPLVKPPPAQGPAPEQMKAEFQMQLEQVKAQAAQDKEAAQAEADVVVANREAQIKAVETQAKADMDAAQTSMKMAFDEKTHQDKMQLEWAKFNAQFGGEQGNLDPATGQRGMSQVEVLSQTMQAMMNSLAQTQALLSAPKRKTAIGPNGKTYHITESLDMGDNPETMVN